MVRLLQRAASRDVTTRPQVALIDGNGTLHRQGSACCPCTAMVPCFCAFLLGCAALHCAAIVCKVGFGLASHVGVSFFLFSDLQDLGLHHTSGCWQTGQQLVLRNRCRMHVL